VIRRLIRDVVPISRVGMALWAWHNRDEIVAWAGFLTVAAPKLVDGKATDVLAEARLRARLTLDGRTRNADGLRIAVDDGVATISGAVTPAVHDAALELATASSGINRVRDDVGPAARRTRISIA
jgi:hypothetical protein